MFMSVDNFVKSEYSLLMNYELQQVNNLGLGAGDYANCYPWQNPYQQLIPSYTYITYTYPCPHPFEKVIKVEKKIYILVGYEKETNTQINISKAFDDQKLAEELQENLSKDESTQWIVHEVTVES
jgi:hypothetical protein